MKLRFKRRVLNSYPFPNAFLTRFLMPFKKTRVWLIKLGSRAKKESHLCSRLKKFEDLDFKKSQLISIKY
jgi:hypothetical protein